MICEIDPVAPYSLFARDNSGFGLDPSDKVVIITRMKLLRLLAAIGALCVGTKALASAAVADFVLTVASNCGPESAAGGLGAGTGAMGGGCSDDDDGAGSGSDTLLASGGIEGPSSHSPHVPSSYEQMQRMRDQYQQRSSNRNQPPSQPPQQNNSSGSSNQAPADSSSVKPMHQGPAPATIKFPSDSSSDSGEASV